MPNCTCGREDPRLIHRFDGEPCYKYNPDDYMVVEEIEPE